MAFLPAPIEYSLLSWFKGGREFMQWLTFGSRRHFVCGAHMSYWWDVDTWPTKKIWWRTEGASCRWNRPHTPLLSVGGLYSCQPPRYWLFVTDIIIDGKHSRCSRMDLACWRTQVVAPNVGEVYRDVYIFNSLPIINMLRILRDLRLVWTKRNFITSHERHNINLSLCLFLYDIQLDLMYSFRK